MTPWSTWFNESNEYSVLVVDRTLGQYLNNLFSIVIFLPTNMKGPPKWQIFTSIHKGTPLRDLPVPGKTLPDIFFKNK